MKSPLNGLADCERRHKGGVATEKIVGRTVLLNHHDYVLDWGVELSRSGDYSEQEQSGDDGGSELHGKTSSDVFCFPDSRGRGPTADRGPIPRFVED